MEELNKIVDSLYMSLNNIITISRQGAAGLTESFLWVDQIKQWIIKNSQTQSGDEHNVG